MFCFSFQTAFVISRSKRTRRFKNGDFRIDRSTKAYNETTVQKLTLLALSELHALLKELVTLVWSHATVRIENVKSFAIAKAAIWLTRLAIVVRTALLIVVVVATVVRSITI